MALTRRTTSPPAQTPAASTWSAAATIATVERAGSVAAWPAQASSRAVTTSALAATRRGRGRERPEGARGRPGVARELGPTPPQGGDRDDEDHDPQQPERPPRAAGDRVTHGVGPRARRPVGLAEPDPRGEHRRHDQGRGGHGGTGDGQAQSAPAQRRVRCCRAHRGPGPRPPGPRAASSMPARSARRSPRAGKPGPTASEAVVPSGRTPAPNAIEPCTGWPSSDTTVHSTR